jgi:hypothetical protein
MFVTHLERPNCVVVPDVSVTGRREANASGIETERGAFDERAEAEERSWEKQSESLEAALRRARE